MMISDNLHDWMIIKMTTALVTQMTEYDHHAAIILFKTKSCIFNVDLFPKKKKTNLSEVISFCSRLTVLILRCFLRYMKPHLFHRLYNCLDWLNVLSSI